MPLDRLVLILILVLAGAGLTVAVAVLAQGLVEMPALGTAVAAPVLLVLYVLVRVVLQRLGSREDDRYDHVEK